MSFFKFLQGIGDRLGILETVSVPGTKAVTQIQTRNVSLGELMTEIKSGAIRSLAESPADLSLSFEKIFESAGIAPNPDGWTIEKLKQWISSGSCAGKPREEAQKLVLEFLKAEGVPIETIVKDAVARDQALDSFEAFAGHKIDARLETQKRKLQEAEARIVLLREECAALEQEMKLDEEAWADWKKRKREKEKDLALTVSYIVDHPVITTENVKNG